jgi:DNA-binding MarR family transcriptional regulator
MAMLAKANEAVAEELLVALGQLVRREAKSGELSWTQAAIMARLDAGRMTKADLARAESMKPQSMGASLTQLEDEGIVRRRAHPTDGRQILHELTAAGIDGRYKSRLAKREWLLLAITRLEKNDQQRLFATIDVIKCVAESLTLTFIAKDRTCRFLSSTPLPP